MTKKSLSRSLMWTWKTFSFLMEPLLISAVLWRSWLSTACDTGHSFKNKLLPRGKLPSCRSSSRNPSAVTLFQTLLLFFVCLFGSKLRCPSPSVLQSAAAAPSPVMGNMPPNDGMPGGPMPPGFFQVREKGICTLPSPIRLPPPPPITRLCRPRPLLWPGLSLALCLLLLF